MQVKALAWLTRWRKQWTIAIVGQESGNVSLLPFLRFRTREQAERWIAEQSREYTEGSPLTAYEPRELT